MKRFKLHGNPKVMHTLRMASGWAFIVLGILGLFLPILQGLLFLAVGVALLAPYVPLFHRLNEWIHRRFPKTRHLVRKVREKFHHHRISPGRDSDASGE